MGMYIENLHVENVGPFKRLDASFNPQMNVIIGVNGVGKTSMLRCITSCMTNNHMENIRLRKNAMFKLNCKIDGKGVTYGADQLVNKDQDYRKFDANNWNVTPADGYEKKTIYEDKVYNLLAIGAYRYFPYKLMDGMKREALRSERRKLYLRENPNYLESMAMPDIKQWMVNRYFQIDKDWAGIERENWYKVMSNLQLIAPRESEFKFVKIERDLEPVFQLNGSQCYLEELSSGFKSILSIVFTIVDWVEGINEGNSAMIDEAIGTVLIDEIDAHLHPSWQMTILESMRKLFPKIQFVVTTHSPNVIMSAKPGEIMMFNNQGGVVNLKPDNRSFGAWKVTDVLTDVMQSPMADYVDISSAIEEINKAYEQRDLKRYHHVLEYLKGVLNPNDSILKVYNIRLSELTLRND